MNSDKTIVVGVTGASGIIYAIHLIKGLLASKACIYCIFSEMGKQVLAHESKNISLFSSPFKGQPIKDYLMKIAILNHSNSNRLIVLESSDFFAKPASGSFQHDGMVVIPCSMKSLASIASGLSDNLLLRSADVCIKEKRKLLIVPREMPFSRIHLKNMLFLTEQNVIILPASPGFYTMPKTISDLADMIAARVMDHLEISHNLGHKWGEMKEI
jgi:4-hydroxy-3-polyprenylbenzoate decarboxylase